MNFTFLKREHLSLKVTNSFMNHYFIDIEFAKLFLSLWYDDDTSVTNENLKLIQAKCVKWFRFDKSIS